MNENREKPFEDVIAGRNAVNEALRSGRAIDKILVTKGERVGSISAIIRKAQQQNILVKEVAQIKLDSMCNGTSHQGIVAIAAAHTFSSVEEILEIAEQRNEPPFIIISDEIEDPHNLGAIMRTAECAGAHGIIIPQRRNVGLTFSVGKASAGAIEYMPVAKVGNLSATIDTLKKKGLWIYGADMGGENWCETDMTGPIALVIGSEGNGIGRLIKDKCDFIVSLPMQGKITSLNASVAGGILMYEISRQRLGIKAK